VIIGSKFYRIFFTRNIGGGKSMENRNVFVFTNRKPRKQGILKEKFKNFIEKTTEESKLFFERKKLPCSRKESIFRYAKKKLIPENSIRYILAT
jgi:hypothetical protein